MSLPARLADQLGKLVPRLGSNHDGEIVATVKAIGRTLASAGHDWHDLAKAVALAEKPRKQPGPPKWRNLAPNERVMAMGKLCAMPGLSAWETSFLESIATRLRQSPWAPVSTRQAAVLDHLLFKAWDADQ